MQTTKQTFAEKVKTIATDYALLLNRFEDAVQVYQERGYASGGSDPITAGEIESLNLTPQQLETLVTMMIQTGVLNANEAAASGYYAATLAQVRTDY